MRLEMETASLCGLGGSSVGTRIVLINAISIIYMHISLGIGCIAISTPYHI